MLKKMAAALVFVLAAAGAAHADSSLDFTLVNATGYGISAVYVAPSASDDWEENLLKSGDVLENSEGLNIKFARAAEGVQKWDVMITFVDDDESVYWRGYELQKIHKITLKYNRESGETTAAVQ